VACKFFTTHHFLSSAHETLVNFTGVERQDLTRSPACQTGSLCTHGCRCRKREIAFGGGKYQGMGVSLSAAAHCFMTRGGIGGRRQERQVWRFVGAPRGKSGMEVKGSHPEHDPGHCQMFKCTTSCHLEDTWVPSSSSP